jgi:hypothetical protein
VFTEEFCDFSVKMINLRRNLEVEETLKPERFGAQKSKIFVGSQTQV